MQKDISVLRHSAAHLLAHKESSMKLHSMLFLCVSIPSLVAMEKQLPLIPCTKMENLENIIPDIAFPQAIHVVRKNVVAAFGKDNEHKERFIVRDLEAPKNIISSLRTGLQSIAVHKSGNYVALSQTKLITVFDTVKSKEEWFYEGNCSLIAFYSTDKPQVVFYDRSRENLIIYSPLYKRKIAVPINVMPTCCPFAHHPTKKEFAHNGDSALTIYDYDENKQVRLEQSFKPALVLGQYYNRDGLCVATMVNDVNESIIVLSSSNGLEYIYPKEKVYLSMLFHSNNKILLLLNGQMDHIECWDYKNKKCIHTIIFFGDNSSFRISHNQLQNRLAISHDGRELFVALRDKCVRILLTFQMLCSEEEKKQLSFKLLLLMDKCSNENNKDIPVLNKDIIYVIMQKLLNLYAFKG